MFKQLKPFAALCVAAGIAFSLAGCGGKDEAAAPKAAAAAKTLTIGVSPVPGGDIMNFLKPKFTEKGVELKVVEFSDYIQPNMALADKSLDANFFQHKPYLDDFVNSQESVNRV
ncbi:MetQ/NlpA family ABC transporter substrate-binding protein [uncultured Sutterella sp.]|uniref:MetQ/NlpA family ABC transporter substrate-binding protein n=1 Tax=uncultured Sutterella sp. TaxID=286133 RepID=UPI00266FAD8B|nr:MetQ/NlpA family ABC transporter substrate-binding protein [uncultured Sutterella sp.]